MYGLASDFCLTYFSFNGKNLLWDALNMHMKLSIITSGLLKANVRSHEILFRWSTNAAILWSE